MGHGLDDEVAGDMTAAVVDALEMVDVEHQQQGRLTGPCHAVELTRQHRLEVAAVGQARQRIAAGQRAQTVDQRLQPRRILRLARRQHLARLRQQGQGRLQAQCGGSRGGGLRGGTVHGAATLSPP
jgi:hypothetical protein